MSYKNKRGFTLIELMVVLAVIAIIAVMAIPSLMNSRKAGVEAKAIDLLRAITTANEQYALRHRSYASSTTTLVNTGYIASYATGTGPYLDEYAFNYSASTYTWSLQLNPTAPGLTADRYFYADQTGVLRFSTSGTATATSSPLDP